MGIMTVTGMSAIVAGLNASMARQIESLGSSVVFVRPWGPGDNMTPEEFRRRRGLTPPEVELLAQKSAIKDISPLEVIATTMIKAGNEKLQNVQVFGTTPSYETVHDLYVEKGRFFVDSDVDSCPQGGGDRGGGGGRPLSLRGAGGQGDLHRRPPLRGHRGGTETGQVPVHQPRQLHPGSAGLHAEAGSPLQLPGRRPEAGFARPAGGRHRADPRDPAPLSARSSTWSGTTSTSSARTPSPTSTTSSRVASTW